MKVLLYTEGLKTIGKSGLGKAVEHQKKALEEYSNSEAASSSLGDALGEALKNKE